MSRIGRARLAPLAAAFAAGCSAGGGAHSLVVGDEGAGGAAGGGAGSGGAPLLFEDASTSKSLSAHIESPPGIVVEVVTLSCDHECADVVVVAKGGNPPYRFTWDDCSPDPARRVCPTESARYEVSVSDTGGTAGELNTVPQTVTARITATVLRCPDGSPEAGVPPEAGETGCGVGFEPGEYEGTFAQTSGLLSGTHRIVLAKSVSSATEEAIRGTLDNTLAGTATTAQVTWGEGSAYYCAERRLFLSGVRSEPGAIIPIPYTYEATYDPASHTLEGRWAAAAPPSPGVYPNAALDNGTWDAHRVGP